MSSYISLGDVAYIYKLTNQNVRVLAHRNQWRRYRDLHGRVHYNLADVTNTLASKDATNDQLVL